VPGGYGSRTLDFLGCVEGTFFAIEAKRPGGKPTSLQSGIMQDIEDAGGETFVINDDESLYSFGIWLENRS
jgi:hypothetical protein